MKEKSAAEHAAESNFIYNKTVDMDMNRVSEISESGVKMFDVY